MWGAWLVAVLATAAPCLALGLFHPAVAELGEPGKGVVLHVELRARGGPLAIALRPDTALFAQSYAIVEVGLGGETTQHASGGPELCQYAGEAPGERPNSAAFSLCNGAVTGVFRLDNETFFASAKESDAEIEVVGVPGNYARGLVDSVLAKEEPKVVDAKPNVTKKPRPPTLRRPPKDLVVELLVVSDAQRRAQFNGDHNAVLDAGAALVGAMNAIFTGFSPVEFINIRITLAGQVVFTDGFDPFGVAAGEGNKFDSVDLLMGMNEWRASVIDKLPSHDVAHLLSGRDFAGDSIGLAFHNAACDQEEACETLHAGYCYQDASLGCCVRNAGAVVEAQLDVRRTTLIASQELGNQLGLFLAGPESGCGKSLTEGDSLMLPSVRGYGDRNDRVGPPDCSRRAFKASWQTKVDASGYHPLGCLARHSISATTASQSAIIHPMRPLPTLGVVARSLPAESEPARRDSGPLYYFAMVLVAAAVALALFLTCQFARYIQRTQNEVSP